MAATRKSRHSRKAPACPVTAYARAVTGGRVVAGRLVKLACARHLEDLKTGKSRGLSWDRTAALHAIEFFTHLRHSTGEWAGQPFVLQPWQAFVVGAVFGWKRADGLRRFRTAYVEVARKNGKSALLAGIALYALIADGEPGAHVYAAATTRDQARIVFGETIGLALAMEDHGATTFRNGARVSGVLRHPQKLGPEAVANLKAGLEAFRAGGDQEGKHLILEEGMDYARIAMTAEDAQWIESRKFSRSDIAMFFGVPPHMIGDTEKSTSWGTGIEQQSIGFVAYTLEDHLTMWEEALDRDLIGADDLLYARFNRAALVKGDIRARWEAYVKGLQWGVWSPNEIRTLEDQNPRDGGDVYYPPPNMTAEAGKAENESIDPDAQADP